MLWKKGRRSDNVVDARNDSGGGGGGMRFGGGKGLSLTAIVLIVGIGWLTGQDPMQILGQLTGQMEQAPSVSTQPRHRRQPTMSKPTLCALCWAIPKTPGAKCSRKTGWPIRTRN